MNADKDFVFNLRSSAFIGGWDFFSASYGRGSEVASEPCVALHANSCKLILGFVRYGGGLPLQGFLDRGPELLGSKWLFEQGTVSETGGNYAVHSRVAGHE